IIGGIPAILASNRISLHASLEITAEQAVHRELGEVYLSLARRQQAFTNRLFPADEPRADGMYRKLDGLMLDVREGGMFQVANQMRRHAVNTTDLVHLEFSCFQELCIIRRNTDFMILHAFLQNRNSVRIGNAF